MFCPKCGNQLIEGSKFCNSCGYKIDEMTHIVDSDTTDQANTVKTKTKINGIALSGFIVSIVSFREFIGNAIISILNYLIINYHLLQQWDVLHETSYVISMILAICASGLTTAGLIITKKEKNLYYKFALIGLIVSVTVFVLSLVITIVSSSIHYAI